MVHWPSNAYGDWTFPRDRRAPTVGHVEAALEQAYSDQAVDRMIDLYCDWREAAADARVAYADYLTVPPPDRTLAFAVYFASVDQEQAAADTYARHIADMGSGR